MMEANSFRIMMLLGSVIIVAAISSFLFFTPIIEIENGDVGETQMIDNYEYVMDVDLGLEPNIKSHKLTVLEGIHFYVVARAGHRNSNY